MQETKELKDVYQIVTNEITKQLEKGTVPWRQPWGDAGIPRNVITNRPYKGINMLLLSSLGYAHNLFLTYNQVNKELGGKIKKGEEGHTVVWWSIKDKPAEDGEEQTENTKVPILRYYKVFNIDQCENLNLDNIPPFVIFEPVHSAEQIVLDMPKCPEIKFKENKAYYEPLRDFINMPKKEKFEKPEAYYSTLFHELVHSTGHHSRLSRPELIQMEEFGSSAYSKEELVAEIGSCYLQSIVGIGNEMENSAAYIQGWLDRLKNDKWLLLTASSLAQKAVEFILNIKPESEEIEHVEKNFV